VAQENRETLAEIGATARLEHRDRHQRWSISLAVGNGAGCVAVGGALITGWKLGLWLALLPALWFFALGVICAGIAALLNLMNAGGTVRMVDSLIEAQLQLETPQPDKEKIKQLANEAEVLPGVTSSKIPEGVMSLLSGALFCIGVLWPLSVVTLGMV